MSVKVNKYSRSVHIHSSAGYLQGSLRGVEGVCVHVLCAFEAEVRLRVHKFRDFQHCGINVNTHTCIAVPARTFHWLPFSPDLVISSNQIFYSMAKS